jgi:hypothetical protein
MLWISLVPTMMYAASPGKAQRDRTVTSYIQVPADSTAPVVLSDSVGSAYLNKVDNVVSIFQSSEEWELNMRSSATRTLWLSFGQAGLPGGDQFVPASIITHCFAISATPVGKLTRGTPTTTCPATLRYDDDPATASTYYRLGFNTAKRPGTEYLRFTCTGFGGQPSNPLSSDPCVQWLVDPADNLNGDGRSTAALVPVTESGGKIVEGATIGYYNFNFQMVITNP